MRVAFAVAIAIILHPRASAAPVPRDDAPADLIGHWELVRWCEFEPDGVYAGRIGAPRPGLEFRANNTLEMRFGVPPLGRPTQENDPQLWRGTFGVRRGVISATFGSPRSEATLSILGLSRDGLVLGLDDGSIGIWRRVPAPKDSTGR
jgi:hypothetical protein